MTVRLEKLGQPFDHYEIALKFHTLETGQDEDFAAVHTPARLMRKYRPHLCHGLANKNSRHDRAGGKMPLKEGVVEGNILNAYDFVPLYFHDAIHQQKRVAVR